MDISKIISLLSALLIGSAALSAQEAVQPNYGMKSPATAEVVRVKVTDTQTLVDISIQNEIKDGHFCIDKNTYLEYGEDERLRLIEAKGLPLCPERYEFSTVGEKVYFTLVFDGLPGGTPWFDIVEYCGTGCLSVLGLTMDKEINSKIDAAYNALDRYDPERAMDIFSELLPVLRSSAHGLTGSVYLSLAELLDANNRDEELQELISEFESTPMPHKEQYRTILRDMGLL
ncbi:MAG: hypothetical protein U5K32_01910 [Bacteroidales bacterium]|nr:hypothetical protein [Bacteroidales bacterium]